jgi:hypothetical protein
MYESTSRLPRQQLTHSQDRLQQKIASRTTESGALARLTLTDYYLLLIMSYLQVTIFFYDYSTCYKFVSCGKG